MKRIVFLALLMSVSLVSCREAGDGVKFTVASETRMCMGVAEMECLLVKRPGETEWSYFYSPIRGFDHEKGYEYVILVTETEIPNPPMDASGKRYELKKVISKKLRQSGNLPPQIPVRNNGN